MKNAEDFRINEIAEERIGLLEHVLSTLINDMLEQEAIPNRQLYQYVTAESRREAFDKFIDSVLGS